MEMTGQMTDWKMRDLFEIIMTNFSKFYNTSQHLAVDEVILKFKGRILCKQYIPIKRKRFGIKRFKLCDSTGYTYDMNVYFGKDRQRAANHLTATHATVTNVTKGVEGFGHKLYMDNFFSTPDLFELSYKARLIRHLFVRSLYKQLKPRSQ